MKLPVYIRSGRANGLFQAYCPVLVGCSAVGSTAEEAVQRVLTHIESYVGDEMQTPLPPGTRRVEIEV